MRSLRKLRKNATYHVTSKINRDENIFEEKEFAEIFLEVVRLAKNIYDFDLRNFCVMPDHIHFLIKPIKNSNLSRIMQWIKSVFAKIFNKRMNYSGHVWKGRFFSKIIEDVKQLVNTFLYIARNPVAAFIVKKATEYEFGGIYFMKRKDFDILSPPMLSKL